MRRRLALPCDLAGACVPKTPAAGSHPPHAREQHGTVQPWRASRAEMSPCRGLYSNSVLRSKESAGRRLALDPLSRRNGRTAAYFPQLATDRAARKGRCSAVLPQGEEPLIRNLLVAVTYEKGRHGSRSPVRAGRSSRNRRGAARRGRRPLALTPLLRPHLRGALPA